MTEPTMIERVARAIAGEEMWEASSDLQKSGWRDNARAAIAAMREPTEAMAANRVVRQHRYSGDIEEAWRNMIDAALAEG